MSNKTAGEKIAATGLEKELAAAKEEAAASSRIEEQLKNILESNKMLIAGLKAKVSIVEQQLTVANERVKELEENTQRQAKTIGNFYDAIKNVGGDPCDFSKAIYKMGEIITACKSAGFLDEGGRVRRVNGSLRFDETGAIASPDGETTYWCLGRDRATFHQVAYATQQPSADVVLYSTREAAVQARDAKGGGA